MEPAAVSERWEVRAQSGGTVTLALDYTRALPARAKTEAKIYGGPDPNFFRIYRVDAGNDVLRSVPSSVDRVKKVQLRVTIPDLKKAFDGSEQIVSVTPFRGYFRGLPLRKPLNRERPRFPRGTRRARSVGRPAHRRPRPSS